MFASWNPICWLDKIWYLIVFNIFHWKAAPEHIEILQSQRQFLLRLNSINDTLILHETKCADFTRRNEIFLDSLKEFFKKYLFLLISYKIFIQRFLSSSAPGGLISVTDPSMRLRDIQLEQCGLLKSKKKPQRIFFSNFDACHKMEKALDNVSFIFKVGDDLRQVKYLW